jgi:hypothetical protein
VIAAFILRTGQPAMTRRRAGLPVGGRTYLALLATLVACSCPPFARSQAPEAKPPASSAESQPAASPPESKPKFPEDGIFWADAAHTKAFFVSEEVFNDFPVKDLPIPERYKVERDEAAIAAEERSYPRPFPECPVGDSSPLGDTISGARSLPDILRSSNLAFVGSVIQVIPGLIVGDPATPISAVGSIVEIDVQEILRRTGESPREGQRLFYRQHSGSIVVRNRRVCTRGNFGRETFRAGPGQRVLAIALGPANGLDPNDPRMVWNALVWPISRSGEVLPQGYFWVKQSAPISLASLRQSLANGHRP